MERNLARFARLAGTLLGGKIRAIVEVGARDCRETLDLHALYPEADIYAFECNPDTLPACRAAATGKPRIHLVEKAVAVRAGRVKFFPVDAAANPGASSLYRASGRFRLETYAQREIEVEAITLREFLDQERVAGVDLLWMDIQGAELAALEGLGPRLADVKLAHLEVEFEEIYAGQPLFPEVRAFLVARGFRFLGFTVYARHSADAVFANGAVFSRRALARALLAHPLLSRKRFTYARHRLKRRLLGR